MPNEAVATYLRAIREGHGLTQDELAQAADVSKRTIERFERNEGDVYAEHLARIIAVLGAGPDEVQYLWMHPAATIGEARELAQALLAHNNPSWNASRRPVADTSGIRTYTRVLREGRDMSRKTLADALGISLSTIADWEAGQVGLPAEMVVRAASHLGGTFDDLLQIAEIGDDGDLAALRIGQERLARLREPRVPDPQLSAATDVRLHRRVTALEGVMHYILGLLKRLLPGEAAEIERTSTLWFKQAMAREDGE